MDTFEQARKHTIRYEGPAPDFFEGALLGNGGLGVVVTTRPDAVMLHFGHNNVWDIRIAEDHAQDIGTFQDVFDKLLAIPAELSSLTEDPWYRDYCDMAGRNYRKAYPKPMPCGSLLLRYDRRDAEVLGHTVHIAEGRCLVDFLIQGKLASLEIFVEPEHDRLWMQMTDASTGEPLPFFHDVSVLPDPDTPQEFPTAHIHKEAGGLVQSFTQILSYVEQPSTPYVSHPKDKAFRLAVRSGANRGFAACVELWEGLYTDFTETANTAPPELEGYSAARVSTEEHWRDYWSRSAVALEDELLERTWYLNLYFFNCAVKAGVTCPGLFANWSYRSIGADWHGDYHMNYNTQQPFWLPFSSNHLDKHIPYVDMIDHVLPVSQKWAKEYYKLRGAYFPHSAYPVEMAMMPYPVPHWGWEICETPWAVQSLWWHYLYTMDESFLRERAFVPMKEAVLFMVDYMKRTEASGERWGDDKYHIFPTVVPELYEISPGFAKNSDCIVDLTLTKFLFKAFTQACGILQEQETESALLQEIEEILSRFPAYPTAQSDRGQVFVSVAGEDPEVVYNVPNPITTVFPGEEHGLHSPKDEYETAVNSYRNHRNEGGNDLVFYNMAGARLGVLDLERFKRQITYCLLPNGTCTDRVLASGGRYADTTNFDFMARMGIWFENFSLPAVINECLLQSYNGCLRFFPNWPKGKSAQFQTLRAVGGFLVSASFHADEVEHIEILSEAGSKLSFYIPWAEGALCIGTFGEKHLQGEAGELETVAGEIIRIVKWLP
ncbi:glycosyl hydrolase family 95 catalytic domain-containing protein [Paenibacillus pectinilyticus]|nr:hypothetical protein [Paenibacillus pectinilyticus]